MKRIHRIAWLTLLGLLLLPAALLRAGSETPPEGPNWERDIVEARKKALEHNVPIFVYFTKTY